MRGPGARPRTGTRAASAGEMPLARRGARRRRPFRGRRFPGRADYPFGASHCNGEVRVAGFNASRGCPATFRDGAFAASGCAPRPVDPGTGAQAAEVAEVAEVERRAAPAVMTCRRRGIREQGRAPPGQGEGERTGRFLRRPVWSFGGSGPCRRLSPEYRSRSDCRARWMKETPGHDGQALTPPCTAQSPMRPATGIFRAALHRHMPAV